jgi:hypothetical protein
MYAPLWYVYNKNVASRWQNPTMYNTLGLSCLCLQAPTIHKLVISLILGMNQRQLKTLCHFYTLNSWWVQIDCCHRLFPEPRMTTTCGDVFLFCASSLGAVRRLAHDQPVTHFLGASSILVTGDYLSFFVTSDIAAISLFPSSAPYNNLSSFSFHPKRIFFYVC